MYILIGGEKGGAGKSTLCVMLAIEAANKGRKVLLIDGDTQSTSSNWIERRRRLTDFACPDYERLEGQTFNKVLKKHQGRYDDVFIDISGRDSAELRTALGFVDLALFPLPPTVPSLETAVNLDALVGEFSKENKLLRGAVVVLWQVPTHSSTKRSSLKNAIEFLSLRQKLQLAKHYGCHRVPYQKAADVGISVTESFGSAYKKNEDAAREIRELYEEMLTYDDVLEQAS